MSLASCLESSIFVRFINVGKSARNSPGYLLVVPSRKANIARADFLPSTLVPVLSAMAHTMVQIYKTLADHLDGAYPHVPVRDGRKIFPIVVTLENWRIFGSVMRKTLTEAVSARLVTANIAPILVEQMPYSIWSVEDFEVGSQIMAAEGIAPFMEGKLRSDEMRDWDWHGYMVERYRRHFPLRKLFEKDYDEIFAALYRAQELEDP